MEADFYAEVPMLTSQECGCSLRIGEGKAACLHHPPPHCYYFLLLAVSSNKLRLITCSLPRPRPASCLKTLSFTAIEIKKERGARNLTAT